LTSCRATIAARLSTATVREASAHPLTAAGTGVRRREKNRRRSISSRHGHAVTPKKPVLLAIIMSAYLLTHLSDQTLLAELAVLVTADRHTTAALLAHLAEVDARALYLPAACSSMHGYCVRVLHLAEDVAFKRIRAARAARRFPRIFSAIADGRLHVSGVVLLAPHLTDDNADELLAAAEHKSKAELEILLARRCPRPDVPTQLEPAPADSPLPAVDR
jgi:hypothetical protein